MPHRIVFTTEARAQFHALKRNNESKHKKVLKTLGFMETNDWHPGLHTHQYDSLVGAKGESVFEAYVENNTPAAYRIFWHYGPEEGVITVIAITPHP